MSRLIDFFSPLARLRDELEDYSPSVAAAYPAINAWQEGEDVVLESEVPGLSIEDVNVLVSGSEINIGGRYKPEEKTADNCLRRECARNAFTRTLSLPWEVSADKATAKLVDGVLTIRLPKSEQSQPKKITVANA